MLITYFRSSSYGAWSLCPQQYFLSYVLGIPQDSGKKAEMGTTFHKVMECLALAKQHVAENRPEPYFVDDQLGQIPIDEKTLFTDAFVDRVFNLAYTYYTFPTRTKHKFAPADKKLIYGWVCKTVERFNGVFDPRNRDIVAAEPHFDLAIEEPWAKYQMQDPRTGEMVDGQLHIKGTIDLITRIGPNMYEVIDWKTGKRMDWGTGAEKDFNKLSVDPQLRIYHYAISRMYPDIEQVVMTINFVRPEEGGPFTMAYGPKDRDDTLRMLRDRFQEIKKCVRPKLKSPRCAHWFCTRVCSYGKNPSKDPNKNICQYIKDKTLKHGIDEVVRTETYEGHTVDHYENPGE